MDKTSRLLLMYSRLIHGERINKLQFSMETGCSLRAFDRDIEDIRLFLSDTFAYSEIQYDRKSNEYSLSNSRTRPFDLYEFFVMERLLLESGVLRKDELAQLLNHLIGDTEQGYLHAGEVKNRLSVYKEDATSVPLLKLHGDLTGCIKRNRVIRIMHRTKTETVEDVEIIPVDIRLESKHLYLVAIHTRETKSNAVQFRLADITSFRDVRETNSIERQEIELYKNRRM